MGVTTDKTRAEDISRTEEYGEQVINVQTFFDTVLPAYERGDGGATLPADVPIARSLVPAGTAALRDFSHIGPEIPQFFNDNCVGCMTCVVECPDTAILAKVVEEPVLESALPGSNGGRDDLRAQFAHTRKFYDAPAKKGAAPGQFGIFIDPSKCKGCRECVEVCHDLGYDALEMIAKQDDILPRYQQRLDFFRRLPETPERFVEGRVLADLMLAERTLLYVGGAGSCAGCGEATAIRMMLAAGGFQVGRENIGIVAATGCNTVYGATYPYNPYLVPWTNSLFENAPADAMGVRMRWDQQGWQDKLLWVLGGDGAMLDIGFQSLSRLLASGLNVKVLVLDTQVYSNTGGQSSTASFTGQVAKMAAYGAALQGKSESRKELSRIAMMHPDTYVVQTTPAHINHFYRAIMGANEYPGPAVVNVFTTCQPEHGVGDDQSAHRAKLAVDSRAFPLLTYDPRRGERIRDRLQLKGNPDMKADWHTRPDGERIDFVYFARGEGRFGKQLDADGNPSAALQLAQQDRLANWRTLQEMAGIL